MSRHLSEEQLVRHHFRLDEGRRERAVSAHLERCELCRGRMAEVAERFGALELLRGEGDLSEDLIGRTVAGVGGRRQEEAPQRGAGLSWRWAALVMVVLGAGLAAWLVSERGVWRDGGRYEGGSGQAEDRGLEALGTEEGDRGLEALGTGEEDRGQDALGTGALRASRPALGTPSVRGYADSSPKGGAGSGRAERSDMPGRVARAGGLTREGAGRPFAPASKIELVVLPRAESLQLTVYNGADLTLVRERRRLVLTEGWNWLQFEWTGTLIDPTSLELEPVEHARQVEVEQLVYPAGLQGVGRWLIWSEVAGEVAFEMSWFVSGVSWRAFYEATLGEGGEMELVGHVRVDNRSGVDFKDAQVRLVVGEVNVVEAIGELARRQWPYGRPGGQVWAEDEVMLGKGVNEWGYFGRMMGGLGGGAYEAKQVLKEGLSEYQLYTIEGTQTLRDGWGTRLKAIEAGGVKVESLYRYDEGRYGGDRGQDARGTEDRGLEALGTKEGDRGLEALGTEEGGLGRAAAMRFLAFVNDREHELGENPLPEGQVRVYERAGRGEGLEYVGASWMKYVPVGEEVELGLGAARRVVVEAKLMGVRTENYEFVSKLGDVSGWEELQSWRVEVANTGAGPVRVELWRHFDVGNWEMEEQAQLGEGEEYERIDMDTVRYALGLGAGQRRELEYTVRLERGSRGLREADEQVGGIVEKLLEPLEFERDEVTR